MRRFLSPTDRLLACSISCSHYTIPNPAAVQLFIPRHNFLSSTDRLLACSTSRSYYTVTIQFISHQFIIHHSSSSEESITISSSQIFTSRRSSVPCLSCPDTGEQDISPWLLSQHGPTPWVKLPKEKSRRLPKLSMDWSKTTWPYSPCPIVNPWPHWFPYGLAYPCLSWS